MPDEHLDALLDLNVRAVFVDAPGRRAPDGRRAAAGAIVLISSQMGHVGAPRRSVYCTTKHAVEGLTKAAAVELAPHGVRVNSVAPTFVDTPMTAALPRRRRASAPRSRARSRSGGSAASRT